jgi:hypothetical protein
MPGIMLALASLDKLQGMALRSPAHQLTRPAPFTCTLGARRSALSAHFKARTHFKTRLHPVIT